jgi:predicted Na+-dependent transporter
VVRDTFGTAAGAILTAVYLIAMMFSVGIGMRAERLPKEKQVGLHLQALLLNLVLIPAVTIILTRGLHLASNVGFALLLVAACPAGRFAPHLARIAGGDVSVATTQVLLLAKIAVLTAPLTIRWLLGLHQLDVDAVPMLVKGFALQMLPLYVGRSIARRRADLATQIEQPLRRFVVVATFAVLAAFLWHSGFTSLEILGDRGWIAVAGVMVATLLFGWLLGGRDPQAIRTLITSGLSRNLALALLVAGLAFPGGHVQLAVFGVWWIFLGAGYLFAWMSAHRRQLAST